MSDTSTQISEGLKNALRSVRWAEYWWCFALEGQYFEGVFEEELQRETCANHLLYTHLETARAIARRQDNDDVLFWLPDHDRPFAVVHLTWSGTIEDDPAFPSVEFFDSLQHFVERGMTEE